MPELVSPSATRARTSRSRGREDRKRIDPSGADEQGLNQRRIDDRVTAGDPPKGVVKHLRAHQPVLEQISDPADRSLCSAVQEAQDEVRLDVLRQEDDAGVGKLSPDRRRRDDSLVPLRRRHPHVDQRRIGAMRTDAGQQLRKARRLGHHVVSQ